MDMVKVDYNPHFYTNILGGAEIRHFYGFDWGYDAPNDFYWLKIGNERLSFKMENYLYVYDPTDDNKIVNVFTSRT